MTEDVDRCQCGHSWEGHDAAGCHEWRRFPEVLNDRECGCLRSRRAARGDGISDTERLAAAGKRYASDKARLKRSRDDLADLVRLAVRHGMSEVDAHKLAGVTRMTVRAWLGK